MLLSHHWRREASGLLGWSIAIAATVLLMVMVVKAFLSGDAAREMSHVLEQLPAAFRSLLGGTEALMTVNGWVVAYVFRTMMPLLLTIYTALGTIGILTKEMDARTMDFLLSLPVQRWQVVLSRFLVLALNLLILHAVLLVTLGVGIQLVGYEPTWPEYALLALNSYLIQLALASLLLLVTVFVDDYTRGLMITVGTGLALFVLPVAIEPGSDLSWLRWISVFAYAQPAEVMKTSAIPWSDVGPLLVAILVFTLLAVQLFERKQLSA